MRNLGDTIHTFVLRLVPEQLVAWDRQINLNRAHCRALLAREPCLIAPKRFSDKMQWRKLFEASPLYTQLSDKIAVRDLISRKGFGAMLIPQLWVGHNAHALPLDDLPRPFVLKSTHASGQVVIVATDKALDRDQLIRQTQDWLDVCYGTAQGEPGYIDVPRRLVVEPLLVNANGDAPVELKVFVFDGVARFAQYITTARDRTRRVAYVTRDWAPLRWRTKTPEIEAPEKPALYEDALVVAERLCSDMDHCRVDFYVQNEKLFIGELTIYSWSGMITHEPEEVDLIMGSFWRLKRPFWRAVVAILTKRWGQA